MKGSGGLRHPCACSEAQRAMATLGEAFEAVLQFLEHCRQHAEQADPDLVPAAIRALGRWGCQHAGGCTGHVSFMDNWQCHPLPEAEWNSCHSASATATAVCAHAAVPCPLHPLPAAALPQSSTRTHETSKDTAAGMHPCQIQLLPPSSASAERITAAAGSWQRPLRRTVSASASCCPTWPPGRGACPSCCLPWCRTQTG